MQKKAKVTKVTKMEKKDSYGNTSFIVEFVNGDKGYYTSKNEDQKNFVPGGEADYLIEEKEGKNGKYFKVKMPESDKPAFKGGGGNKFVAPEPRITMISFAASYTKDLIVAGKVDFKDFGLTFDVIYNEMISKLP